MPFTLLQSVCAVLLAVVLMGAALQDFRTLHIANGFPLAVVVLFAILASIELEAGRTSVLAVGLAVGCAVLVFAAGAAAFAAGALGGGDVKLMASVALFAGPARLMDFMAITAVTGGVLGIAVLAGAPIGAAIADRRVRVPYGPAIAAGGLWLAATPGMG